MDNSRISIQIEQKDIEIHNVTCLITARSPGWFVGDPTPLACDNINNGKVMSTKK